MGSKIIILILVLFISLPSWGRARFAYNYLEPVETACVYANSQASIASENLIVRAYPISHNHILIRAEYAVTKFKKSDLDIHIKILKTNLEDFIRLKRLQEVFTIQIQKVAYDPVSKEFTDVTKDKKKE